MIDRDEQPILRQGELLGNQPPGEFDRERLEIIAEREIAEHFKKRMVPRRIADIVEIIVLAAGAHAFLGAGGAHIGSFFEAGEKVLELHHPGVGEHQGRIVARNERRRRHDLVAVLLEKIEEARADFVNAVHLLFRFASRAFWLARTQMAPFGPCIRRRLDHRVNIVRRLRRLAISRRLCASPDQAQASRSLKSIASPQNAFGAPKTQASKGKARRARARGDVEAFSPGRFGASC